MKRASIFILALSFSMLTLQTPPVQAQDKGAALYILSPVPVFSGSSPVNLYGASALFSWVLTSSHG